MQGRRDSAPHASSHGAERAAQLHSPDTVPYTVGAPTPPPTPPMPYALSRSPQSRLGTSPCIIYANFLVLLPPYFPLYLDFSPLQPTRPD